MTSKRVKIVGSGFLIALILFTFAGYQFGKDMALRENAREHQASSPKYFAQ